MTRILLLLTFTSCLFLESTAWLNEQGMTLAGIGNLPHRYLGLLYMAHLLRPDRADFASNYLTQWSITMAEERFAEGTTRPVVPQLAARLQRDPYLGRYESVRVACEFAKAVQRGKVVAK